MNTLCRILALAGMSVAPTAVAAASDACESVAVRNGRDLVPSAMGPLVVQDGGHWLSLRDQVDLGVFGPPPSARGDGRVRGAYSKSKDEYSVRYIEDGRVLSSVVVDRSSKLQTGQYNTLVEPILGGVATWWRFDADGLRQIVLEAEKSLHVDPLIRTPIADAYVYAGSLLDSAPGDVAVAAVAWDGHVGRFHVDSATRTLMMDWSVDEPTRFGVQVVTTPDLVIVASLTYVVAYEAATGKERWRLPERAQSITATLDGVVFVGNETGVRRVSASDGSIQWTWERAGVLNSSALLVQGDVLYELSGDCDWRKDIDALRLAGPHGGNVLGSACGHMGDPSQVTALDVADGALRCVR